MEERKIINFKQKLHFFPIFLFILFLDQFTKVLIVKDMLYGDSKSIIGDIVKLTYIRNPNSVFGLNFGGPVVSTILTVVAFLFVMVLFDRSDNRFSLVGLSFIIGGALGNLTDRVLYMEVIDFIQVGFKGWYWPTFNVADSCVTIGLILIIIYYIFIETSHRETKPEEV